MSDIPLGRFAWYELLTTDPKAAPDFYGAITGWSTAPFEGTGEPYTMWMNGESPVGGIMQLPEEAVAGGAPPHWLVHISTPDLETTKAKVEDLGGSIMTEMSIPEVGSFAIIQDPHGAVVSAYQPSGDAPGHDGMPKVGEFSWNELMSDNYEESFDFYSGVFGWEKGEPMDMGEMGTYQIFQRGEQILGGMMTKPPEMPVSMWTFYVRVPDVHAAVEKVKELGGQVVNGPMEVPGGDMIAMCTDPQGAMFAVHHLAGG